MGTRKEAKLVGQRIKEMDVRIILTFALLTLAACDVDNDAANESVTLEYNKQQIREGAVKAGRTARQVASGVGNVAAGTGRAIKNEVGDVDVDVNVTRNRSSDAPR